METRSTTIRSTTVFRWLVLLLALAIGVLAWGDTPAAGEGPAPYLRIEKSAYGDPGEGGNFSFHIEYWNDGDAAAESTVITDTMEGGIEYLADTSGITPTGGGSGPIFWDLGIVPANSSGRFDIFAQVTAGQSNPITNTVRIATSNPDDQGDPGEKESSWSGTIAANDTDLNVGKSGWTGDPAPGTDLVFSVNVCNHGSTSSSELTLTDTLPPELTLQYWWAQQPGWTQEISNSNQLVVSRPTIPGGWCGEVYLRVHLAGSASPSMSISNTAVITASNDLEGDDNESTWEGQVNDPHANLYVNKNWGGGGLAPGGELRYDIDYGNNGNVPVTSAIYFTDTLPESTSFNSAWYHDEEGPQPFAPAFTTTHHIVWEIGGLDNGYSGSFTVMLDVNTGANPGTVLTNTVKISPQPEEDSYDDNVAIVVETLYDHGPNLRVRKWHNWDGNGRLNYNVRIENIGTEPVYNVVVTDTYPSGATFNDESGNDFWEEVSFTHDGGQRQLIWELDRLEPGWETGMWFNVDLDDGGAPVRWYTNTVEIGPTAGDTNPGDNTYTDVAFSGGEVDRVEIWMNTSGSSNMWGSAKPGASVTVTTPHNQVTAWADPGCDGCWNIDDAGPIHPGDTIAVTAGAGLMPVVIPVPVPYSAEADSAADNVFGQIGGWLNDMMQVHGSWPGGYREVQTDASGYYTATYSDVPRGADGYVRHATSINYAEVVFHRPFQTLDLIMTVDYADDWVNGNYEAGHTVWITVTESDESTVKATAEFATGPIPDWGGGSGFRTGGEDWVPGPGVDIEPGDWVYGLVDNGYTSTVHVGTINGEVNVDVDTVSGTIDAPWLAPDLVTVSCEIHEENGESLEVYSIYPDGGAFFCDFGGMWDIEPGQNVAVNYTEPDSDRVQAHPPNPAPYLRIEKSADGNPGEGGNFTFHIQYWNDGDGPAENTIITDNMLGGIVHLSDTSGFSHTGSGSGPIVWDLGTVPPNSSSQFDVVVQITAVESDTITNTVQIATSTPYDQGDPWEKESSWTGHVQTNDTHLNVGKWAWTGDPAAGTDLIFSVNVCNNGSTSSSELTLTDTLPPALMLQDWWAQHPGWTQVISSSNQLVVSRPTIPGGWWCGEVYLRVHLDGAAWSGMSISNTAVIAASNDLELHDNETTWWGQVNDPHTNLYVNKDWSSGQLVPGGQIHYVISYGNDGNVPVNGILITDTLPANTSFNSAWHNDEYGPQPMTPAEVTAEYVVWEIGGLDNGYNASFTLMLDVNGDANPGAVLTNTVQISPQPEEDSYDDNVATVVETLYETGPNLRVRKWHNWDGNGRLNYNIRIENVGTEPVYNVVVTDTYPTGTTFNGERGHDFWEEVSFTHDDGQRQLIWELDRLEPGWETGMSFNVDLVDPGAPVRWYTNTVEIGPPAGDTNPGDNTYTDVAFSGGEVDWVDLDVYGNDVYGCAPNGPITITTAVEQRVIDGECFNEWFDDPFEPGGVVTVAAGSGAYPVVIEIPDPFTAQADSGIDEVWGQIDALDHEWVEVDLSGYDTQHVQTDGSGNYVAHFSDVPRGGEGEVRYRTEIGYADVTFHRPFQTLDLVMTVDYGHDWVNGNYEPGHTVWITVTDDLGLVKATAELATGPIPDWGGQSGFRTGGEDWVPGPGVDIVPGDWVYGLVDNGYTNTVHVGTINGEVNVDANTVSGTIDAPWLAPDLVTVSCEIHEENGESLEVYSIYPDGGAFLCDFGGKWDIEPGHNVAVNYTEPDSDRVQTHPPNPTPYLLIEKSADGSPGEGGNFTFHIQYWNDGDAPAENTIITDNMLGGIVYLSDTSGFSHTGSGSGSIVWDLGPVPPNNWGQFDVIVQITAVESDTITNTVQIATSTPYDQGDPWEKESSWTGHVQTNDTHLNVGKWAWTGDPAAGTDLIFSVNVCNNGSTSSSELTLTDTLPPELTLQDWWAQHPGWTEVSSNSNQLVVSRPTIPGWWCGEVYLRVHLDQDAWSGMSISNTAVIAASNDLELHDNETTWWGQVNDPHTNLYVNKDWSSGQLVPGGQIHYVISYGNDGNVPVNGILITDTFPASTSFNSAWYNDEYGPQPMTPAQGTAEYVVWEIGGLDNGYSGSFTVMLDVNTGANPGTVLTNTVKISPQPEEDSYDDNVAIVVETLYDHGPNLRVRKWHNWDGNGRLNYNIRIENVGTQPVYNVVVTDTYPTGTMFNDESGNDFWENIILFYDGAHRRLIWELDRLEPGWETGVWFNVDLDDPAAPVGWYTNTVEIGPTAGDTNPGDNTYTDVAFSGGAISGVVYSSDGSQTLANVNVDIDQGGFGACTDENGVYLISGLPLGDYRVRAGGGWNWCENQDSPYVVEYYSETMDVDAAEVFVIGAGSFAHAGVDFTMDIGGVIAGFVLDLYGDPLSNINVSVEIPDQGGGGGACTDENGAYTIRALPHGSYRVDAGGDWNWCQNQPGEYVRQYYDHTHDWEQATLLALEAGSDSYTGINFNLEPGGIIEGYVRDAETDLPLSNINVGANRTDHSGGESACTDENGYYIIYGLPYGDYVVNAGEDWSWCHEGPSEYVREYYDNAYFEEDATPVPVDQNTSPVTGIDFYLERGGAITGRVTDAGGSPLENVRVQANTYDDGSHYYRSAWTDASGTYTITGLVDEDYRVAVENSENMPGDYAQQYWPYTFAHDLAERVEIREGDTQTGIDFALQPGGVIVGYVLDQNDQPLANLQVGADLLDDQGGRGSCTDQNGYFELGMLMYSEYAVYAGGDWDWCRQEQSEYVRTYFDGVYFRDEATPLLVDSPTPLGPFTIRPATGGYIAGTVVDDGSIPLPGIRVEARLSRSGEDCPWCWETMADTETEADGTYLLGPLPPYDYVVYACVDCNQPGLLLVSEYYDNAYSPEMANPVPVQLQQTTGGIDFQLDPGVWLTGTVTVPDGYSDAGIHIDVWKNEGWWYGTWAETDASGAYTAAVPPIYDSRWGVAARPYDTDLGFQWANDFYLDDQTHWDFDLGPGGTISGCITDGEEPVVGLWVNADSEFMNEGAQTDADGCYGITNLPPGDYRVQAEGWPDRIRNFYGGHEWDWATLLVLDEGETIAGIDFETPLVGEIEGHVYESNGETPIEGVRVVAMNDDGFWEGYSQPNGYFALDAPVGEHKLMVQPKDWGAYVFGFYGWSYTYQDATPVTVLPLSEGPLSVTINLDRRATLSGVIRDVDTEQGVGGIHVAAKTIQAAMGVENANWTCTDEDGNYTIEGLFPGQTEVIAVGTCGAQGYGVVTATVTITAGNPPLHLLVKQGTAPQRPFTIRAEESFDYTPLSSGSSLQVTEADQILPALFSPLVQLDDQGQWFSELLTQVPTVANGGAVMVDGRLVVTYTLEAGLLWSDGEPLTSADIRFAWEMMVQPQPSLDSYWAQAGAAWKIERVETPDAETAVLVYAREQAPPDYLGAIPYPMPEHILASEHPIDVRWLSQYAHNPVGNGPYVVVDWVPGSHLDLVANPRYHKHEVDDLPRIRKIRFLFNQDPFFSLLSGEADVGLNATDNLPADYERFGLAVHTTVADGFAAIIPDNRLPFFADQQVREALYHALDRASWAAGFAPAVVPADSWLPPDHPMYTDTVTTYDFNLETAAQMLTDTLWIDSNGNGIRDQDGVEFAFDLYYNEENPQRQAISTRFQADLATIGVDVNVIPLPWSDLLEEARHGRLDAFTMGWGFGSRYDPQAYPLFHSRWTASGYNAYRGLLYTGHWQSGANDDLLEQARHELDAAALRDLYAQQIALLSQEVPIWVTRHYARHDVATPILLNFRPHQTTPATWNIEEWKLPKNPYDLSVRQTLAEDSEAPQPGAIIIYEIHVQNSGYFTMENAILMDVLPEQVVYGSATPAPSDIVDNKLYWNLGDIPGYQPYSPIRVTVSISGGVVHDTVITNTVQVWADQTDTRPENDAYVYQLTVRDDVDLEVTKSGVGQPFIGADYEYYINYANWGGAPAYDVVLTDTLPLSVTLIAADPVTSTQDGQVLTWNLDTLQGNQWGGQIKLNTNITASGALTNTVTITPYDDETTYDNNWDDHFEVVSGILAPIITQPTEGMTKLTPTVAGLAPAESAVDIYDISDPDNHAWITQTVATVTGAFSVELDLDPRGYILQATAAKDGLTSAGSNVSTITVDEGMSERMDTDLVSVTARDAIISQGVVRANVRTLAERVLDIQAPVTCHVTPTVKLRVTENGLFTYRLPPVETTDLDGDEWLADFRLWLSEPHSTYDIWLEWDCDGTTDQELLLFILIDPDGFLYDQALVDAGSDITDSLVLNGVITAYVWLDPDWIVWPAEFYGQFNPQWSDGTTPDGVMEPGYYSFLTPPGRYRIEAVAPGYQPFQSGVLLVAHEPIRLDIGLLPIVGGTGKTLSPANLSESIKRVTPSQVMVGDTLVYSITLHNSGDKDTGPLILTDTIPARTTYVDGSLICDSGSALYDNGEIHWTGTVPGSGEVHLGYEVTVASTPGSPYDVVSQGAAAGLPEDVSSLVLLRLEARARVANQVGVDLRSNEAQTTYPGETAIYEHIVENTGNYSHTFSISATSSLDWGMIMSPTEVTLEDGESAAVQVAVTVPPGAPDGMDEMVITATSVTHPDFSDSVTDHTTVGRVGVDMHIDEAQSAYPGDAVHYLHEVENTGNRIHTFALSAHSSLDWAVSWAPAQVTLEAGESAAVQVTVTVPAESQAGDVDTTVITATSVTHSDFASVTDTTTVSRVTAVSLSPGQEDAADPGEEVTYAHLLTNTGNAPDTFTLFALSSQDWAITHSPHPALPGGASTTVYVTITIPADGIAGTVDETTLTAVSQFDPSAAATMTDTTTINQVADVSLSPGQEDSVDPGEEVTYAHLMTNTGNGPDTFTLSALSSQGWAVAYSPDPTLAAGASTTVYVTVTVPADAIAGTVDETALTSESQLDTGVSVSATDSTTVNQVADVSLSPGQEESVDPGEEIAYAHLLTNTGNGPDTFTLSALSSQGWAVTYSPDPTLAAGASTTIHVTVAVPADAIAGTVDKTTLTAESEFDSSLAVIATDTTMVNQVADASLSPGQEESVDPGEEITYAHLLTNTSNGPDTFTLSALSSQGWSVTHSPDPTLAAGASTTIHVTVAVPADAIAGAVDETTLTAESQLDASVSVSVIDRTTAADATPPSGTIQVNGGDTYTRDPVVNLTLVATDNVAVTEMQLSYNDSVRDWEPYAGSKSITLAGADGTQSVSVKYRDAAGNTSSSYGDSIILDATPPSSAVDPLPATQTAVAFSISWSASDVTSGVSCYDVQYRDGAVGTWTAWKSCTTGTLATFTGADGHTYYFRSRAQDNAGNWESYPTSPDYDTHTTVQVDDQAPTGSILINGGDAYANNVTVELTLAASGNATVTEMRLFYNNTLHNWETYAASKSITLTGSDGIQAVSVEYMDADGNTSSTYTDTIILDTTPPSSAVDALPATQDDITFSVVWSGSDATSGISCFDVQYRDEINGAWTAWQTCVIDASATFTGTAGHTYYFRSRAQDNADNWESYPTSPDYDTFTALPEPPHPPPVSYDVFLPLVLRQ